jgi:hypothetical protein
MAIQDDDEFGGLTMNHSKPNAKPIKKLAPPPTAGPSRATHATDNHSLLDVSAASPAAAQAPSQSAAVANSWDDLLAPVPPAPVQNQPSASSSAPAQSWDAMLSPPANASAAAPAASVDALFDSVPGAQGSTSAAAPQPAANANSQLMTDSDFDAFLSGLKS